MVNRLRLQVFVAVVGLFAVAVALAYFLLVITPTSEPAPGGTYVEGVVVDNAALVNLNPLVAPANSFSQDVTALVFSGLTRSVPGKSQREGGQVIEPDLAERWTASADGRDWEFRLRRDARWQDGTPITARDVVYTVSLLKSEDYPGGRDLASLWKGVEASRLGDYTVRFRLEQPWPAFLSYTTLGILPYHKLQGKIKAADLGRPDLEFNQAPVGNGPYQLAPGGRASDGLTLIANPLYYGKKPYLDKIWFRYYPSPSAALSAFQTNQIDGVSEVTAGELKRLDALKNVTDFSAPGARTTFFFLNLQRSELFGQKEVRQGLAYAINRPALIEKALAGQAQLSQSPILSTSWAYKSDLKTYDYDPVRAAKTLDEAGWKIGREGVRERNGQRLVFRVLINDRPERQTAFDMLADNLKAVGVVAQRDVAPTTADLDAALKAGNYDALIFTVEGALNDPDQYVNWHSNYAELGLNHLNFANWRLNRADKLLEDARSTVQQDDRRKLYFQWQDIWADELPSIPLYCSTYSYLISNRVQGVQKDNLKIINVASDRLKDISSRYIFTSTKFGS